ncbi:hypothetical protein OMP38_07825 [Cohnella ginsengisoli]|uniref:Uncharacterized protein n=1 Tax=Cohnella ginsengisoli TaxID=425004 RepID=A0A9X4KEU7_9BACL|nr:hypothetical protein [Cohnella ginsengisoli]MDG0790778.1 hypothetical protein [Cohnella ginsengisoli]
MLLIGLFAVGLPGAMIYLGKQYQGRQRELLGAYLLLGLGFGALGLAVGEMALPLLLGDESGEVLQYARIAMLCLPFAVLTDGLIGALQSRNQFKKVLILRVLSPLGQIAVIGGTGGDRAFNRGRPDLVQHGTLGRTYVSIDHDLGRSRDPPLVARFSDAGQGSDVERRQDFRRFNRRHFRGGTSISSCYRWHCRRTRSACTR